MTRKIVSTAVIITMTISTISAFTPSIRPPQHFVTTARGDITVTRSSSTLREDTPFFLNTEGETSEPVDLKTAALTVDIQKSKPVAKNSKKAATTSAHRDGIFSPVVRAAKVFLGEDKLNKVRATAISKHSEVITGFVETSETTFGTVVLKQLFKLADKDGNGAISKEELQTALASLGFDWLKDKQIQGIFARADADGNGTISLDEWIAEAPKTLRTNLVKLAKKNGGELGFLS